MIRRNLTYANITATLALLFAMSGGALAASHYLITSTKQIKPSVLTALKGKAGPAGAAGAPGTQGPAGPQGPQGAAGTNGTAGATGASGAGKEGPTGKEGATGKEGKAGSPWTAGGYLPKGASETGIWGTHFNPASTEPHAIVPLSFTIPLETAPNSEHVLLVAEGETKAGQCEGTAANPTAVAGYLCVYLAHPEGLEPEKLGLLAANVEGDGGASKSGALLFLDYEGKPPSEEAFVGGSWAVTAP